MLVRRHLATALFTNATAADCSETIGYTAATSSQSQQERGRRTSVFYTRYEYCKTCNIMLTTNLDDDVHIDQQSDLGLERHRQ